MTEYNKLLIASSMYLEAHHKFIGATKDIDYIVSIILSGAVVGIVAPLLKEQGGKTAHQIFAEVGNLLVEDSDADFHEGIFRKIYNSFKHTGNRRKGIKPSDDLTINTNLKNEAAHMLDAARDDFREIQIPETISSQFSKDFVTIIDSLEYYA